MSGAYRTANATVAAHDAVPVTLSDSTQIPATRSIYVGTGGNIKVTMADERDVTFTNVPGGSILPIQATKIWSSSTTASNLIALY